MGFPRHGKGNKRPLPMAHAGFMAGGMPRPSVSPHMLGPFAGGGGGLVGPQPQFLQEPVIKWLELTFQDPLVAKRGLPHVGPALHYDADFGSLLGSANWILADLVGGNIESSDNLELHHDDNWMTFPGVGMALHHVGAAEVGFCIAICPSKDLWGVGLANKWKQRESAAKLALCVALTWNIGDDFDLMAARHPEFGTFCEAEGYVKPGSAASRMKSRKRIHGGPSTDWGHSGPLPDQLRVAIERVAADRKMAPPEDDDEEEAAGLAEPPAAKARGKGVKKEPRGGGGGGLLAAKQEAPEVQDGSAYMAATVAGGEVAPEMPRDVALWIQVGEGEEMPPLLENLRRDAPVLSTDGSQKKALYNKVDEVLASLLAQPETEVEYHDDPNWETFPVVGAELKKLGQAEECMGVAVCLSRAVWAVGVGSKWRNRCAAAKTALVAAIAQQDIEMGELVELSSYPSVAEYVEEAKLAHMALP